MCVYTSLYINMYSFYHTKTAGLILMKLYINVAQTSE